MVLIFWLRSLSCMRRILAEAWSLNDKHEHALDHLYQLVKEQVAQQL